MTRTFHVIIGGCLAALTYAPLVLAAPKPDADPCTYLGGGFCTSSGGVENMVNSAIKAFGEFFALGGGAFAVIAIAIGGFMMLLSFGDEGRFNKGKESIQWGIIGFGLVLATQVIVNFVADQVAPAGQSDLPFLVLFEQVVNSVLILLNISFVLIAIAAGIRAIVGRGKTEEFSAAKKALGFAIAGAILVNLARALAYATLHLFG